MTAPVPGPPGPPGPAAGGVAVTDPVGGGSGTPVTPPRWPPRFKFDKAASVPPLPLFPGPRFGAVAVSEPPLFPEDPPSPPSSPPELPRDVLLRLMAAVGRAGGLPAFSAAAGGCPQGGGWKQQQLGEA